MYSYDIPVKSSWERRDPGQCRNSLGRADEPGTAPHWRRCPVPACCASLGGRRPSETEILPRTPCLRVAEEFLAPVFLWAPFWLPQSTSQSFRDLLFQAGKLPFAGGRLKALWGLQDSLTVTKQGLEAHISVSHTGMIGTFFLFSVTLTVPQRWRLADMVSCESWLKTAVFLLIPTAPWGNAMGTNVLWTITLFFVFEAFLQAGLLQSLLC